MYRDLKSRLQLYKMGAGCGSQRMTKTGSDIQDLIEGHICSNDNGSCFIIENRYPFSYLHGGCRLGDALSINPETLGRVCSDFREGTKIKDFLFLDTETTGLSGGTGTVAFLVGTGFFEDGAFVIKQYFMRDYDEEPAMLTELNALLSRYSGLITFNGRAFDWNLLQTRFIFNRIKPVLLDPSHIDLLYPSRRIWRLKLESCGLQSIEENILNEIRIDDVPGAEIPSIYFKYLESRNAGIIKKVIRHNEIDILSMVSLLVRISKMLDNPVEESDGGQELLGLGRIFESSREYDVVIDCFENCVKSKNSIVRETALRKLSGIYKKNGNYSKAVECWKRMMTDSKIPGLFPMIELAKYYEHKEKNIEEALVIVEKAMLVCRQTNFINNAYYDDLKKRKDRLIRKSRRG
ncbi:MAG TPA: ribonuclease H-like domain-containing protein [Clostridiaceae bacterium]|nr:ribonuclease H-like domain-containing protein [Clostridiaceae bacterium]